MIRLLVRRVNVHPDDQSPIPAKTCVVIGDGRKGIHQKVLVLQCFRKVPHYM